jgi:phage head maturation protease
MSREFKQLQFTNIKAEAEGRIRVGIAAVHGNVDSWGDRSHFGSFAKTIAEGMKRVRHLWMHNSSQPPIASIIKLEEVGRDELPSEVLAKAPDATGGLKVWREYYPKDINPISEVVLYGIDKGDINEMSYAYDVTRADYTEEENEAGQKIQIRELREIRLYDTSDVNYGMNSATVAAGAKGLALELLPLGNLYQQFLMHLEEAKAGRRNSVSDLALLNQMHQIAVDLGAECAPVDGDEETAKAKPTGNEPDDRADAAHLSTSPGSEWLELRKRKAKILEL